MTNAIRFAATAAFILAATPAFADTPTVDGIVGAGEYGAPTATVATNPAAPVSNFDAPGNSATFGYNIYLNDTNDTLYGAGSQTGGSEAAPGFANLYFDLDPATGTGGSEIGLEVTNRRGFIAGVPGFYDFSTRITFNTVIANGLTTTEFSVANSVFRDFITAIGASGYFPGGYTAQNVRLNLSQSLGYSVAGGTSYGPNRLGSFSVAAAAVPETSTWMMMIAGFGLIGAAARRRAARTSVSFA